jgi:endonuclease/exonuclease/phosphatase family metal-dependent hydrolase
VPKKNTNKRKHSIFTKVLAVLNILAILALLMAYAAPHIHPARSVIPALFGLAYPYIAVLNVIFIIFFLVIRKYFFIGSLLALAIGWTHIGNHLQFRNRRQITDSIAGFKLMSYNVRMFDFYHYKKDSASLASILANIENESPDIACFQEFFSAKKTNDPIVEKIRNIHQLNYYHIEYVYSDSNDHRFGIATYSRFPVVTRGKLRMPGEEKGFGIFTDILINTDTLRIFNVHLASLRFAKEDYSFVADLSRNNGHNATLKQGSLKIFRKLRRAYKQRAVQADILAGVIASSPYPVFVCGDFNDTPVSYTYHRISQGLSDSFTKAGYGIGQTYSGILPSFRIDYILYGSSYSAFNFKTGKAGKSDHHPVSAWFVKP